MSLLNDFHNICSESEAWVYLILIMLLGAIIAILIEMIALMFNKRDTYFHGQIDALRGIVKYELKRNEDGEEVWTKIEDPK